MKFSVDTSNKREKNYTSGDMQLVDLFSVEGAAFDLVIADLKGDHGATINNVSERVYFILSGKGIVMVDGRIYDVQPNDLIYIKPGQPHSISGEIKYLIITSPPFNSANESKVQTTKVQTTKV
jgi:mannose-6-phosphate isomerase-like protein (cupin superfamily)